MAPRKQSPATTTPSSRLKELFGNRPVPADLVALHAYERSCEEAGVGSAFSRVDDLSTAIEPDEIPAQVAQLAKRKELAELNAVLAWVASSNELAFGYMYRKSGVMVVSYDAKNTFTVLGPSLFEALWSFLSGRPEQGNDAVQEAKLVLAKIASEAELDWTPPKAPYVHTAKAKEETAALNQAVASMSAG